MSFVVRTLLVTILIPGAISFVLAIASRRWSAEARLHRALVAAAFGLAVIAGSWGVMGTPTLAPLDISSWLPHVAIVGMLAAIGAAWTERPALRYGAMAVAACVIAYVLLRPLLGRYSGAHAIAAFAIAAGLLGLYSAALDQTLRRTSPRVGATVALISAAAAAAAVAASGTLSVGQVGGAAAAGVGGLWLVALVRPSPLTAAALPIAGVGWSVLALGHLYASLSASIACLVLAVPAVALVVATVAARWSARKAAVVVLGTTVAAAGVAIALAIVAGLPSEPEPTAAGATTDDNYGYE